MNPRARRKGFLEDITLREILLAITAIGGALAGFKNHGDTARVGAREEDRYTKVVSIMSGMSVREDSIVVALANHRHPLPRRAKGERLESEPPEIHKKGIAGRAWSATTDGVGRFFGWITSPFRG